VKLLSLELRAFGPFRDVALDFSGEAGVHVIYGPNEAGKSTALRAITGLFYGIPHLSPDAHTHRPEDLRIGGTLASAAGARLSIVRRKGRVRTLLDRSGEPLPEHALSPFLGGIGEEVFRAAFGLDHETLRMGAQALLEGRGHLGESLFGAGLGGTGIAAVLESLRREADELYSPLARTKKLNLAIRAVIDAKKRAQDAAMPASAWLAQEQAIKDALAERARIDDEAARLRAEERRLRRARQLSGLFAQLRSARSARALLAGVVLLPDDAASERATAEAELSDAAAQSRRAEEALARLVEQRDALSIPHALLAQADAVDDLTTRLGSHKKALVDLPRVRAELRAHEEEALETLRSLGVRAAPAALHDFAALRAEVEPLRVDAAREERLRALARDAAVLGERVRQAEEELRRADGEVAVLRARSSPPGDVCAEPSRPSALPADAGPDGSHRNALPADAGLLRRAVARAKALGDAAAAIAKARRAEAQLHARAFAACSAQKLAAEAIRAIPSLPVPLPETVDLFAEEERALADERSSLAGRLADARAALARTSHALAEVSAEGLPTEADLDAARAARGEAVRAVRSAVAAGDHAQAAASLDALERAVEAADRAADRLRAEADRVAQRARLAAERRTREEALASLERAEADLAARAEAFASRWREAWAPCAIAPRSPAEMRGWLRRHDALVALVMEADEAAREREALHARAAACAADLASALSASSTAPLVAPLPGPAAALSPSAPPDPAALPELLDAAERRLAAIDEAERLARDLVAAEASRDAAERRLAAHQAALEAHRRDWEAAAAGLPVRDGASPAEVLRALDMLGKLFARLDESRRTARRVEGMERDARELSSRVLTVAREHAPDLAGRPVEAAAVEIARRFHQARSDLEKQAVLQQQILAAHEAIAEQRARADRALGRLAALRAAAGASTLEELVRAESLSLEAKRLDRQIELYSSQIRDVGDSAPEEELHREVEAIGESAEALGARIEELEERLADNARERSQIDRTIGARTEGLAKLREGGSAADAALDLEAAIAEARALALSYARSRAASLVLEREIEAYKRRHQGPIVRRAGELFRALTLGSFAGLSAGIGGDDQASLVCVREGGREVDVDGLSDGTRDQLYLALRLASIERFAAHAEPLPLVLDDAFVHFDDARAREALVALAGLSPAVQVLFFTHHDRLVAIAGGALGEQRCKIHRLPRGGRPERTSGAAPSPMETSEENAVDRGRGT
jgi:uncharacterized protein YhaN